MRPLGSRQSPSSRDRRLASSCRHPRSTGRPATTRRDGYAARAIPFLSGGDLVKTCVRRPGRAAPMGRRFAIRDEPSVGRNAGAFVVHQSHGWRLVLGPPSFAGRVQDELGSRRRAVVAPSRLVIQLAAPSARGDRASAPIIESRRHSPRGRRTRGADRQARTSGQNLGAALHERALCSTDRVADLQLPCCARSCT